MQDPKMYKLLPFICDDLHFDCKEVDSYNMAFNFIVSEREAGKSTLLWKKVYNAFKNEDRPSIILRRMIVDITEQYIEDIAKIINKFTKANIALEYVKQEIKNGQMDVKLNGRLFFRIIGLSAPMSRLKSMFIKDAKYMIMDEFICNLRLGEKYLQDEPFRVKELYTTYNRETVAAHPGKPIKFYAFGNPYSLFNPYFSDMCINTNKLYPGAIIKGNNYVIQCYQIKPELKKKILANNPLYQFDDAYKRYAFDGRAIQDADIRIMEDQPKNFRLAYTMKLHNKILGVFRGYDRDLQLHYWCRIMKPSEVGAWRNIVCFDFGQMASRTVLLNNNGKKLYGYLKESIEHRWIAYQTIESSYFMEEVYQEL